MTRWLRAAITALAVLAVANLVGFAALLGWLFATERMDGTRFGEIRRIIGTPISEARELEERRAAAEREEAERAIERVRLALPPRTASERAGEIDRSLDEAQLRRRMVEEEARLLGRSLDERAAQLRESQMAFDRSQEERRASTEAEQALLRDAQFRKTIALLDAAPPAQTKEWMLELMRSGRREDAVRYLDGMSKFAAGRVLRELKSAEETALAADLIQSMTHRTSSRDGSDDTR